MTSDLPPSLADALRPVLPELAGAIIEAIGREVPAYARPLEGPFGEALRRGVRTALARFVDGIEHPGAEDPEARALYVQLGRGEFRGGRSLDALLSAYRIGARLAWERFLAAGEAAGFAPPTLYRLASAIFSYIDGISADSVEGYAQERAAAEGERQRRRRALARLLAREGADLEEVHDSARLAGWPRPATVGALVVGAGEDLDADRLASRLGGQAIATAAADGTALAWVPDPQAPGRRAQLAGLRPAARARLSATLRAWLDHPGQVQPVAERLHVHPQTVRCRMAQLRELFGERPDDPDARFELALALRAGEPRPGGPQPAGQPIGPDGPAVT